MIDFCRKHSHVESSAGAAHLLNDDASVRGKACLILIFSTNTNCESMACRPFRSEEYSAGGDRKVTTGTTHRQLQAWIPQGWINPCGTMLQCTIPRSRPMSRGHHIGIRLLGGRVCFAATSLIVPSSSVLSSKHGSKRHNGFIGRNNVHLEADIRVTVEFMCVRSRIRCRMRAAVFLFVGLTN